MLDLANGVNHQIQTKIPQNSISSVSAERKNGVRGPSRARNTHLKSLSRMANGVWRETARRHSKAHYLLAAIFSDGFEIFKPHKDFCEIPASPRWLETHTKTAAQSSPGAAERAEASYEINHVTYLGWIFLTCRSLGPCVLLLRNILMPLTFIIIEFSCNGRRRARVCGERCFDERERLWVSLSPRTGLNNWRSFLLTQHR